MKQDTSLENLRTTKDESYLSEPLRSILAEHERWLRTNGTEGRRANLAKADLRLVDLSGRNLSRAQLPNASLQHTNLSGANLAFALLSGADLQGADLTGADLTGGMLIGANLSGANFSAATLERTNVYGAIGIEVLLQAGINLGKIQGLLASDLARRDLGGLILPEDLSKFKGVDQTAELCKLSQTILLAVVGSCFYSWLTIATTTDVMFVTNYTPTTLPIIQTPVSTVGFYFTMPVLLFAVSIYFHMYVQRLWDVLSNLPAIFPDGRTIDETIYPWMLTSLISPHLKASRYRRPQYWRLQLVISVILAWIIIPFTIALFWLRYLSRHDVLGSALHIALLATAIVSTIVFYRRATLTLDGHTPAMEKKRGMLRLINGPFVLRVVTLAITLGIFSEAAVNGRRVWDYEPWSWAPRAIIPQVLTYFGLPPFLTIRGDAKLGANVSLRGRDLRQADVAGVSLQGVDLADARLDEAHLMSSDLEKAYMLRASLRSADLNRANLSLAMLVGVDLSDAVMPGVRLTGADAQLINLSNAQLRCHRIANEKPECAKLQGAILRRGTLDNADLKDADLRNSDLRAASLRNTELSGALLTNADFRCLSFTIIGERQCTDIRGTDLSGAIGLVPDQLKEACGDDHTRLPPNISPVRICTDAEFIRQPPPR